MWLDTCCCGSSRYASSACRPVGLLWREVKRVMESKSRLLLRRQLGHVAAGPKLPPRFAPLACRPPAVQHPCCDTTQHYSQRPAAWQVATRGTFALAAPNQTPDQRPSSALPIGIRWLLFSLPCLPRSSAPTPTSVVANILAPTAMSHCCDSQPSKRWRSPSLPPPPHPTRQCALAPVPLCS